MDQPGDLDMNCDIHYIDIYEDNQFCPSVFQYNFHFNNDGSLSGEYQHVLQYNFNYNDDKSLSGEDQHVFEEGICVPLELPGENTNHNDDHFFFDSIQKILDKLGNAHNILNAIDCMVNVYLRAGTLSEDNIISIFEARSHFLDIEIPYREGKHENKLLKDIYLCEDMHYIQFQNMLIDFIKVIENAGVARMKLCGDILSMLDGKVQININE